jgi:hypothetical protein
MIETTEAWLFISPRAFRWGSIIDLWLQIGLRDSSSGGTTHHWQKAQLMGLCLITCRHGGTAQTGVLSGEFGKGLMETPIFGVTRLRPDFSILKAILKPWQNSKEKGYTSCSCT